MTAGLLNMRLALLGRHEDRYAYELGRLLYDNATQHSLTGSEPPLVLPWTASAQETKALRSL